MMIENNSYEVSKNEDELTPYELYKLNQAERNAPKPLSKWVILSVATISFALAFSIYQDMMLK
jgi:hypothetical protein